MYPLISFFFVLLIGISGWFGYETLVSTWNNDATWSIKNTVSMPENIEGLKVSKEIDGHGAKINVDYCVLYDIEVGKNINTYKCSLQPLYNWEAKLYDSKETSSETQIIFTVDTNVLPERFLNRNDISKESITSIGSTPISVSLQIKYENRQSNTGSIKEYNEHYPAEWFVYDASLLDTFRDMLGVNKTVDIVCGTSDSVHCIGK